MSWQACDAIDKLPYDACGHMAYRVLQKLANVAAEDGSRAFRHAGAMAAELGVSKRSVQRSLKELEAARLIIRGDQRLVSYERPDRRPTVYNVNMLAYHDFEQQEWTLDETSENGVTELSTVPQNVDKLSTGVTNGVTTVDADKERRELTTSNTQRNHRGVVTPCGHPLITDRHCAFGCKPIEVNA